MSPPISPAKLWACVDLRYYQADLQIDVIVTTNVPCHLWLRWSYEKLDSHKITRIRRGLPIPSDVFLCFDIYQDIEQNEVGDTLSHRFWLRFFHETALILQTIYFYLVGEIDGAPSPSESCVFTFTYSHRYELYSPAWNSAWGLNNGWLQAQSFRPDHKHNITKIHPWLAHRYDPVTIHAYIHHARSNGCPYGDPLAVGKHEIFDYHASWYYFIPHIYLNLFAQPVPPFNFYEPWGQTFTDNYPWEEHGILPNSTVTVANSRVTLFNDAQSGINIATPVLPDPLPLLDPSNTHLYVHYCSPTTIIEPIYGWLTYIFVTEKAGEEFDIEPIIARGTLWGPFDTHEAQWNSVYAFDLGKGPDIFDLTQRWIRGRTLAGLSTNPSGWRLTRIFITNEQGANYTQQTHVNNYLAIAYQQYPPAPSDDYPIKGTSFRVLPTHDYCIVLTQTPVGPGATAWRGTTIGTYPKGIHSKHDIPPSWVPQPTEDLNFSEWGIHVY